MYKFRLARVNLDLFPQTPDMYIYCSCISGIIVPPYEIQKIFPAVYLVRIRCKKFQNIPLFGRQIDLAVPD